MIIVPSSSSKKLSTDLAAEMNGKVAEVKKKRFPDGELYVRIVDDLSGEDVIVVGNTRKDEDLLEMMLLLNAAKECGPKSVKAVMPYFGYARQHMRYNEGEPISSKVFTIFLSTFSDSMYTVEIHDEETLEYTQKPFKNIRIRSSIARFYEDKKLDYVASPDDGGAERAKSISEILGCGFFAMDKKRIDSNTVVMKAPDIDLKGKNVLLVDDIISTGGTIARAASILKEKGAGRTYISAIHGVFSAESGQLLSGAADGFAVTDSIITDYSSISIARELAENIRG